MHPASDPQEALRRVLSDGIQSTITQTERRWTPQPHQVPPPGDDWMGWLMLAGRGAGKTEACAHYLVDHVNGPPCLSGSVPHWMGIIGPTLGDAATACFAGPSGIRHFSPEAEMKAMPGGLLIRWPNGSQAKMYGTNEENDVERLRAGGNTCVKANTLVRTARGQVEIENITVGDQVWTSSGLRTVLRAGQTGVKRLWVLELNDGRTLHATGDHRIRTQRGEVPLQCLIPGDTIWTWNDSRPSRTTASVGTLGVMGTTVRDVDARTKENHFFIDTSGPSITDQYLSKCRGCTCTTKITISRITTSPISYLSRQSSTRVRTLGSLGRGSQEETRRGHGENMSTARASSAETRCGHAVCRCVRRVITTDAVTSTFTGEAVSQEPVKTATASSVAVRLTLKSGQRRGRARLSVGPRTSPRFEEIKVRHTRNGCTACARSVALGLSAPPSTHAVSLAPQVVRRVYESNDVEPVYDLMVEHDHEFFADDVLVMNCLVWCEEMAAWRYLQDAYDQMRFGLRVGRHPRWIGSTTPKPRPLIKKLAKGEVRSVVITHATMYDNPHLPPHIREALEETYAGTAIGTQELYGRLIEEDKNALFNRENIAVNRVASAPALKKIEVGLDPSGGAGEQGIVVVGAETRFFDKGKVERHGYVLDDLTVRMKPEGWGRVAVNAAVDWDADCIVVETNFGGDMAVSTVQTAAEHLGVAIPIRTVHASRGKAPRAQPVSAMSAQGRWHMVGVHEELEDQLCTWTTDMGWSPDRMDAMVWPAWHMKLVTTVFRAMGSFSGHQVVSKTLTRRRS